MLSHAGCPCGPLIAACSDYLGGALDCCSASGQCGNSSEVGGRTHCSFRFCILLMSVRSRALRLFPAALWDWLPEGLRQVPDTSRDAEHDSRDESDDTLHTERKHQSDQWNHQYLRQANAAFCVARVTGSVRIYRYLFSCVESGHAGLHTHVPFANSFALSHAMRLDPPVEFEQILSCVSAWTKLRQMFPALRFTSSWAPCTTTTCHTRDNA